MKREKSHVSVVVVGHVDSGKSTVTGHFAYKVGAVDDRTIQKFEKEASEMGRSSFKYAWVLDRTQNERSRGITIQHTTTKFETEKNTITIIDAPGHRDFIANLIKGVANAECCLLTVPATRGEFETAVGSEGCFIQQSRLVLTAGANKQASCIVNKMDAVGYDEARFNEIRAFLMKTLKSIGFNPNSIAYIPISGLVGDNLVTPSEKMPWYTGWECKVKHPSQGLVTLQGKTLYDWFNTLIEPERNYDGELRGCCQATVKVPNVGPVVTAHIEQGTINTGQLLSFTPSEITAEVKSIEMHHQLLQKAVSGDSIGMVLKGVAFDDVKKGDVFGDALGDPPRPCKSFVAQLMVNQTVGKGSIKKNYQPVLHVHSTSAPVKLAEILCILDKKTLKPLPSTLTGLDGEELSLKTGDYAQVRFQPVRPICVEPFKEIPSLGRFSVRDSTVTVGFGVIQSVEKEEAKELKGAAAAKVAKAAKAARAAKK